MYENGIWTVSKQKNSNLNLMCFHTNVSLFYTSLENKENNHGNEIIKFLRITAIRTKIDISSHKMAAQSPK